MNNLVLLGIDQLVSEHIQFIEQSLILVLGFAFFHLLSQLLQLTRTQHQISTWAEDGTSPDLL